MRPSIVAFLDVPIEHLSIVSTFMFMPNPVHVLSWNDRPNYYRPTS